MRIPLAPATKDGIRAARIALGMSRSRLASLLGVHERTLERWEQGAVPIPALLPRAIRDVRRCTAMRASDHAAKHRYRAREAMRRSRLNAAREAGSEPDPFW